jgi:creatinine amidohydrolase/Fe(II)-dependent formamide hydrolase-like protein
MRRIDEYRDKLKVNLRFQSYWDVYDRDLVAAIMEKDNLPGHACEYETSTMLVLDPDRVHTDDIENEAALVATREKGETLIEPGIAGVAGIVEKMIARRRDRMPAENLSQGRPHPHDYRRVSVGLSRLEDFLFN